MNIAKKIFDKRYMYDNDPVTIAFLGDSVTQGCFECYFNENDGLETVFDYNSAFATRVWEILNMLYPYAQINIINSGKSGGCVFDCESVLERDVLQFSPDLVVVSYGLNDSYKGENGLEKYGSSLSAVFEKVKESGSEIIFLTQNYMCTQISPFLTEEKLIKVAEELSYRQNTGLLDAYFDKARSVCAEHGVPVCDLYALWKAMNLGGVDVTELLSNKLNHPSREYHSYIAVKLVETMFEK